MSNFSTSNWFADRAKLKIQNWTVEDVDFELMALTDDLIDGVHMCTTYKDMLKIAANSGISYNRKRVIDDSELAKDIDMFWALDDMYTEEDPCIQYRVGEKVCDISGLSDFIAERLEFEMNEEIKEEDARLKAEAEKNGTIKVGEHDLPADVTLDSLNDDAAAAA